MNISNTRALIWFRQDLRVKDNPALINAAKHDNILPVYIYDTTLPENAELGGASKWWLHYALESLQTSLNGNLIVLSGKPQEILSALCAEHDISNVYWNRMYESWAIARDTAIKISLKTNGVEAKSTNGSLLWEPMQVLKKDETPYKVFTPYYKNGCLNATHPRYPEAQPRLQFMHSISNMDGYQATDSLALLPKIKWDTHIKDMWNVSEQGAQQKLECFIKDAIENYDDARNLPSVRGTSQLSPYLHFGLISPNQAWYAVHDAYDGSREKKGVYVFLSELGWREFSYYLLFHFTDIQNKNFNTKFDKFPWAKDPKSLRAWQRGNTGVPIIDAGMRELYQTGYMHNRVRMVVASYLVKNLLIDWREGERWFWDCLVDADTASNAAGWQWVAGSGADAAPYFRIFNPILQGEKFDKEGEYVRKYCPELSKLGKKFLHKPWEATPEELLAAGVVLGKDYPEPIVDLKASRHRALDAYASIK
ncbi:MAG: deoxyribodipyrimidine photo-lyase [Alphaproteobacteria bacterium]|jgi:deoxyribodipyrimidine photo-lyase